MIRFTAAFKTVYFVKKIAVSCSPGQYLAPMPFLFTNALHIGCKNGVIEFDKFGSL